jgi:organic hydroperoxide reductase OsmC/OhrA
MTLDEHLGALYRERVILGRDGGAAAALAAALAADTELAAQARTRLEELRQIAEQRCFVSAQHRRSLEAALGQERR